jgi:tRNA dimethylallyltransferase
LSVTLEFILQCRAKGVWQSIGLKEFLPYLNHLRRHHAEINELHEDVKSKEILLQCVEELKTHTRQYARNQSAWVRNHFRAKSPQKIFVVNTNHYSSPEIWASKVRDPVVTLATAFIKGADETILAPDPIQVLHPLKRNTRADFEAHHEVKECSTCNKTLRGETEWQTHLASRGHRRASKALRRGSKDTESAY